LKEEISKNAEQRTYYEGFCQNRIYTYVSSGNSMRIISLSKHAFEKNRIVTSRVQVNKIAVLLSKIEKTSSLLSSNATGHLREKLLMLGKEAINYA
jgi:hypothetical protein